MTTRNLPKNVLKNGSKLANQNLLKAKLVFEPRQIEQLGYEYSDDVVKSFNETGYMRNFLCEVSQSFCRQKKTRDDVFLEVGCGLGAAIQRQIVCGIKNIIGVDSEAKHLAAVKILLKEKLLSYPDVHCRLICDSLPHLKRLKADSFRSILCAQTLHYLKPKDFETALARFHELLKKDGTLYITMGSPYLEVYQGFADEYAKRFAAGDRFPGYMEDVKRWHPQGIGHNLGFFLFFDPVALERIVSEFGFKVQRSFFF